MAAAKSGYNVEVGMNLSPFEQGLSALRGMGSRITGAFSSAGSAVSGLLGKIFSLKGAIAGAAGAAGLYGLERAISSCVRAAAGAEDSQMGLANALSATGNYTAESTQGLLDYAKERMRATRFDDDATVAAMANLAAFRLSASEIRQVIPVIQDFAAAKRIDLVTASQLVGRALVGEGQELRRQGITIEETGGSATRLADVMRALSVFSGRAEASARTGAGAWAQMHNEFEEVKEAIGDFFLKSEGGRAILTFLTDKARELVGWIEANRVAIGAWIESGIKTAFEWLQSLARSIAEFVAQGGLEEYWHRAAIGLLALKVVAQSVWLAIKVLILGAVYVIGLFLQAMAKGEQMLMGPLRRVFGTSSAEVTAAGVGMTGFWAGYSEAAATATAEITASVADSAHSIEATWDEMMRHGAAVNRAIGGGGTGGGGRPGSIDSYMNARYGEVAEETRAVTGGLHDQDVARTAALAHARRLLTDLGDAVEHEIKTETETLQKELEKQIEARERAEKKIEEIQQKARESADTAMERRFDLYTRGMGGRQLTQMLGRMEREMLTRARASLASGQFEEALRRFGSASGYVEKAFEQAQTPADRALLLREMRRLESERQSIFRRQEADERQRANAARDSIEQLQSRLTALQTQARQRLEIASNFPELAAQVESIRRNLDAMENRTIEIVTGRPATGAAPEDMTPWDTAAAEGRVERPRPPSPMALDPHELGAALREASALDTAALIRAAIDAGILSPSPAAAPAGAGAQAVVGQSLADFTAAVLGDSSATAVQTAATEALTEAQRQLIARFDAIGAEIRSIAASQGTGEAHAAGGWISGGTPGIDSVRALLTPGEFVVNARSAAANRAALDAINAGFAMPARFARGGAVFGGGSAAAARESGPVTVNFYGPGDKEFVRNVVIPGIEQAVRRGRAGTLLGRG